MLARCTNLFTEFKITDFTNSEEFKMKSVLIILLILLVRYDVIIGQPTTVRNEWSLNDLEWTAKLMHRLISAIEVLEATERLNNGLSNAENEPLLSTTRFIAENMNENLAMFLNGSNLDDKVSDMKMRSILEHNSISVNQSLAFLGQQLRTVSKEFGTKLQLMIQAVGFVLER